MHKNKDFRRFPTKGQPPNKGQRPPPKVSFIQRLHCSMKRSSIRGRCDSIILSLQRLQRFQEVIFRGCFKAPTLLVSLIRRLFLLPTFYYILFASEECPCLSRSCLVWAVMLKKPFKTASVRLAPSLPNYLGLFKERSLYQILFIGLKILPHP